MKTKSLLLLITALAGGGALAGEVDFATKPQARRAGGKTVITFAVKKATDVEVAILDAGGKVLRHLAAGALGGKKAPPAPLKAGLSQSVEWDGKDDAGKPARGAARVRVRLGLKPVFDRTVGGDPARHGGPLGLGCGPKGTLYVLYRCGGPGHHYASMGIKAYDREGKYLRQVMPYPANLKPEQRTAVKWLKLDDGSSVPLVYYAHSRVMYPGTGSGGRHNLMVRPDGKLAFSNHPFDRPSITTRRMLVFGADGSCGADLLGPRTTRGKVGGWLLTALSPDGKTVYISGGRNRKGAVPAVFKTSWGSTAEPTVFVGSETAPGSDAKSLAAPRGVAVDGKGNVYVCDHLNNRVSVFSPAGKPLAQMPAEYADLVAVHPETGAVYVLTTRHNPKMVRGRNWGSGANFLDKKLLKFRDYKAKAPMATIQLAKSSPARPSMALDPGAKPPVLWLSGLVWGNGDVKKIVDRGAKFEDAGTPISARVAKGTLGTGWLDMAVDRHTDGIIVSQQSRQFVSWKYDGRSGKSLGTVKFKSRMGRGQWGEVAFSWDGKSILHTTSLEKLYLFNLDGSKLPWPELGKNEMGDIPQGFTHARGHAPAPDGSYYIAHHLKHRDYKRGAVSQVSAGGKVVRKEFIKLGCPIGGVKVGPAGNVYVAAHIKPAGQKTPEWFKGKVPARQMRWYKDMYGSILKIKPAGGEVDSVTAAPVVWAYHGVSPMPSRRTAGCSCQIPRFDVDLYGRVWVPDTFRFSVAVLDNNANSITRFGGYGNAESAGPKSKIPEPKIPFAWVHSVQVTDGRAYAADVMNHRIVAMKLEAAAEAGCSLP